MDHDNLKVQTEGLIQRQWISWGTTYAQEFLEFDRQHRKIMWQREILACFVFFSCQVFGISFCSPGYYSSMAFGIKGELPWGIFNHFAWGTSLRGISLIHVDYYSVKALNISVNWNACRIILYRL